MPATISINRAPVLPFWAAVVAQRLGFRWDESLSRENVPQGKAFALYEAFRPAVPAGVKGWGAKGVLDLRKIRLLAKGWNPRGGVAG